MLILLSLLHPAEKLQELACSVVTPPPAGLLQEPLLPPSHPRVHQSSSLTCAPSLHEQERPRRSRAEEPVQTCSSVFCRKKMNLTSEVATTTPCCSSSATAKNRSRWSSRKQRRQKTCQWIFAFYGKGYFTCGQIILIIIIWRIIMWLFLLLNNCETSRCLFAFQIQIQIWKKNSNKNRKYIKKRMCIYIHTHTVIQDKWIISLL